MNTINKERGKPPLLTGRCALCNAEVRVFIGLAPEAVRHDLGVCTKCVRALAIRLDNNEGINRRK